MSDQTTPAPQNLTELGLEVERYLADHKLGEAKEAVINFIIQLDRRNLRILMPHDPALFEVDIRSNAKIKNYRAELGLETPGNRIDTGDLRMILLALNELGWVVVNKDHFKL